MIHRKALCEAKATVSSVAKSVCVCHISRKNPRMSSNCHFLFVPVHVDLSACLARVFILFPLDRPIVDGLLTNKSKSKTVRFIWNLNDLARVLSLQYIFGRF